MCLELKNFNDITIKHKASLLNLTEEWGKISKACQMTAEAAPLCRRGCLHKTSRLTESQIIAVLHETEADMKVKEVCRKYGIYEWWILRSITPPLSPAALNIRS